MVGVLVNNDVSLPRGVTGVSGTEFSYRMLIVTGMATFTSCCLSVQLWSSVKKNRKWQHTDRNRAQLKPRISRCSVKVSSAIASQSFGRVAWVIVPCV